MDIEEAKKEIDKMSSEILDLINSFEVNTGLTVESIPIERLHAFDGSKSILTAINPRVIVERK